MLLAHPDSLELVAILGRKSAKLTVAKGRFCDFTEISKSLVGHQRIQLGGDDGHSGSTCRLGGSRGSQLPRLPTEYAFERRFERGPGQADVGSLQGGD